MGVMDWAECPVCGCVVTDQAAHITGLHEPLNRSLSPTPDAPTPAMPGDRMWGGPPVPSPPAAPSPAEATTLVTLRERSRGAIAAINGEVIPAMDSYLALTSPTAAQVSAQVRTLTRVVRVLALLNRDLVRLAVRALDAID